MKDILLVVDYQKDFVDGALGFEKATILDEGIAKEIKKCWDNDGIVIFTYDTHGYNYLETREGKKLPVTHCIEGTEGWTLFGKVKEARDEGIAADKPYYEIRKDTFGSTGLMIAMANIKEIFGQELNIKVCGVVTNMCVISNAVVVKATAPEANITILEYLCASNDESLHKKAIDVMDSMQMDIKYFEDAE